jgi:hypothetical protein
MQINETLDVSDQDRIRDIINNLLQGNKIWLTQKNILVGNKSGSWILNYQKGPRNEYNKLVRGMVVKQPVGNFAGDPLTLIQSFPFVRFFNQHEPDADTVDLSNAEMIEKLDGSMIGLYFPNGDIKNPQWHTRKMISSHKPDMDMNVTAFTGESFQLMQLIGSYVKQLRFNNDEDAYHTYVFEFIHSASTVLTKYNQHQYGLYLLAVRNLQTHREETENAIDEIALRIGAKRPRRWDSIADENDITLMMNQAASEVENFEGYVFRDKDTGKRIKVKNADYVKIHHMLGDLSTKKLIPRILEGEEEEILNYFPQVKIKIDDIKQKHINYVNYVTNLIKDHKGFANNKELADVVYDKNSDINDKWAKYEIMKLHRVEDKNIQLMVDDDLIKLGLQYLPSYMELIRVKDENEGEDM